MSQFYASIEGNRGEATRMGTKASGIHGHIRGWSVGARVDVWHDDETGLDQVSVYATGGSNARSRERLIARYTTTDLATMKECDVS